MTIREYEIDRALDQYYLGCWQKEAIKQSLSLLLTKRRHYYNLEDFLSLRVVIFYDDSTIGVKLVEIGSRLLEFLPRGLYYQDLGPVDFFVTTY